MKKVLSIQIIIVLLVAGTLAGCGGDDMSNSPDAGSPDADPNFFDPDGTWSMGLRADAIVRATYAEPAVTREGTATAVDIYLSPVSDLELVATFFYNKRNHELTLLLGGEERLLPLDENNAASVTIEGPSTERVETTLCDITRTVTVDLVFESSTYISETFIQTIAYQDIDGECTQPQGTCTCGQIIATGLTGDLPDPFYSSLAEAQTVDEELVLDVTLAEELNELTITYYVDGEHVEL